MYLLGEAPVVGRKARTRRRSWIAGCLLVGWVVEVDGERAWIGDVEARVTGEDVQDLAVVGQPAAEDGLMDEVDSKLRRMTGAGMRDIITKLMLLLIAVDRERGNRRNKLIIAEGLKSGRGQSGCAERKRQPESEVGVSQLDMMKAAGLVDEVADPGRRKHKLIADQHAVIVRRGRESGGR